jgi:hypothetical protein
MDIMPGRGREQQQEQKTEDHRTLLAIWQKLPGQRPAALAVTIGWLPEDGQEIALPAI